MNSISKPTKDQERNLNQGLEFAKMPVMSREHGKKGYFPNVTKDQRRQMVREFERTAMDLGVNPDDRTSSTETSKFAGPAQPSTAKIQISPGVFVDL